MGFVSSRGETLSVCPSVQLLAIYRNMAGQYNEQDSLRVAVLVLVPGLNGCTMQYTLLQHPALVSGRK